MVAGIAVQLQAEALMQSQVAYACRSCAKQRSPISSFTVLGLLAARVCSYPVQADTSQQKRVLVLDARLAPFCSHG
jgi:hypothetical protein